ncbi:MAG: glycosyltransferase family 1 protein [Chlorobi bacterium]|nr:glycosyltransferase family 1 protein [Chlorobiota bacterium]
MNTIKNLPNWHTVSIQPHYTGKLKKLDELSRNIWWSWNNEAVELFKYISNYDAISDCIDPAVMLKSITQERFKELQNDTKFIKKFEKVFTDFENYLNTSFNPDLPSVAYFSMEYGLTGILKIYSGGLGVLAGDYLKQASDSGYDMTAVGLFYRQGYFTQQISQNGYQDEIYESQRFMDTPAELVKDKNGEAITVAIEMEGRKVYAQIWQINVGRVKLFLLDTDRNDNSDEDKAITYRLYGGDNENRLRQEMILGIGGVKALNRMGIKKDIYHLNEGHAAFTVVERLKCLMQAEKLFFNEALEIVRASNLFTTHTPVPAGHDAFTESLLMQYMGDYPNKLGISWNKFINLGKENHADKDEKFSMSVLAANTSQEINGVSKLHREVSRKLIFNHMWPGYFPEELHIGYVTNGVHYPTWTSTIWKEKLKGKDGKIDFNKIYQISDEEIWKIRQQQKTQLSDYISEVIDNVRINRNENPKEIVQIKNNFNKYALTIGFARRFATYKRGNLLFNDLDRLNDIVNNPKFPVQFIFAGKSHPKDGGGKEIIKQIVEISKRPEFIGKILFLENYNMTLAKELVKGVDVWLNTPVRPLEASGTSGMKAVMNGVLNFSVLDGWWVEGYKKNAGWALSQYNTYKNNELQNEYDAQQIYRILEDEIIPLYYKRDSDDLPENWILYIKKCMSEIASEFTTERMINDYRDRFYLKLKERYTVLSSENFEKAKEIADWKENIASEWKKIKTEQFDVNELTNKYLIPGQTYKGGIKLNINGLKSKDVGVEMVISESNDEGELKISKIIELQRETVEGSLIYYSFYFTPSKPGSINYAFRIFPKHPLLAHRQDCSVVRWL